MLARMDSNRTGGDFFRAHPDWFARMESGEPYRAADKYVTCINSPYYTDYLPDVLREIIERSRPDGFADKHWSGSAARRASVTATIAFAAFALKRVRRFHAVKIGPMPLIDNGLNGTTVGASKSGT